MRFTNTLLLALSAVAVRSAVIAQDNNATQNTDANQQNTQANTQQNNTQQNNNQLTAEAQCVINNKCNDDVACIARCYNVPAPTSDMVYQTNDCAVKCPDPAIDNAGYLKCYNDCVDNFYMGNNNGAAPAATNNNANTNANANTNTNTDANGNTTTDANANTTNGNNNTLNGNNNANNTNTNANKPNNTKINTSNTIENTSNGTSMKISALAIATAFAALLF